MFIREAAISSSEEPFSSRRVGRSFVPHTTTKRKGRSLSRWRREYHSKSSQVPPGNFFRITFSSFSFKFFIKSHLLVPLHILSDTTRVSRMCAWLYFRGPGQIFSAVTYFKTTYDPFVTPFHHHNLFEIVCQGPSTTLHSLSVKIVKVELVV